MIKFYEVFNDNLILHTVCAKLTWSHLRRLIYIEDELKREFYIAMSVSEHWSFRTLNERINSMLYERTQISKLPEETINTVLMDKGYLQEIMREDAHSDKLQSSQYYQKWMKLRTDDIQFVLDTIIGTKKSNTTDTIYGLVDYSKIGVIGHSLGGSAALGIGRMRKDVGAVIALESPFLCDIKGVKDGEFVFEDANYPIPVLNVYTDSSWSHLSEWTQYLQNNRMLLSSQSFVHNYHIPGSGHLSITDLALASPVLTRVLNGHKTSIDAHHCLRIINRITLEFFDHYLKGYPQIP
ncbi:MAG: isoform II [Firmicutes bacterium ADurb.Bin419]|nr:MAG: isoform II [Firmicutes bacterium ADurb.Bin419]